MKKILVSLSFILLIVASLGLYNNVQAEGTDELRYPTAAPLFDKLK